MLFLLRNLSFTTKLFQNVFKTFGYNNNFISSLNFFLHTLNAKTAKIHFVVNLQLLLDCFFFIEIPFSVYFI